MKEDCKYLTKEAVLKRARELAEAKITFGELGPGRISGHNKGNLGQIVEEMWYEYKPNSDRGPDFQEAGVELKVSPYKKVTKHGKETVSAKERLVCDIINYVEEVNRKFEESAFWQKCKCICLLSYEWSKGVDKSEMYVNHAVLLDGYPEEDLLILKQDWEVIVGKIRMGQAHLITEGDTKYLSACTKGATAGTLRKQPYSDVRAKQRAYSLKTAYMTRILRKYIFGLETDEHIIKDFGVLEEKKFNDVILEMFKSFLGKNSREIAIEFKIDWKDTAQIKNMNATIIRHILGVKDDPDKTQEFESANISVKTIVIDNDGIPEQSMSFPAFSFEDLLNQDWEDSDVYNQMVASQFLMVVFKRRDKKDIPVLKDVFFWNLPMIDVEELRRVWEMTRTEIRMGVRFCIKGNKVSNSLPKASDSYLAHVRPHAQNAAYKFKDGTIIGNPEKDADPLPDGQWMTKQCFWFNKRYIQQVVWQHLNNGAMKEN